jgi:hypothetical protein
MISITFVEQPESASTRHHHTVNQARAAAALPSVIGGPGTNFMTDQLSSLLAYSLAEAAMPRALQIHSSIIQLNMIRASWRSI